MPLQPEQPVVVKISVKLRTMGENHMKISITYKLFLAILTAAALAVISLVLIMQWSLSRGFLRFVNGMETEGLSRLAAALEEGYRTERNWNFVRRDPARWRHLVASALPRDGALPTGGPPPPLPGGEQHRPPRPVPPPAAHQFDQRLFLMDADRTVVVSRSSIPAGSAATPLRNNGRIVGYLGLLPRARLSDSHQQRFLREQKLAFVLVSWVIVLVAACFSLLLARRLVRPLRELARATHRLTAGEFGARVPVVSSDELGRLAADFNLLALTLEKNETARRQWVADISHELRTPLTVLRGEIEAIQDGIRQPTPEAMHSLHDEALRLGRLVDDLYQLALSDLGALTYRKADLDPAVPLGDALAAYRPEFAAKDISLTAEFPPGDGVTVFGDAGRLRQLFVNLLDNTLKYTNAGGSLHISMALRGGSVTIDFQDSAPGVPSEELEKLFDRLYRVESSRSRSTGGAGLGLAICRSITEAHGGSITVKPSPIGGVWIRIELPPTGAER